MTSGLTTSETYRLRAACRPLWVGLGGCTYHVGSSLDGDGHDVDVRTILDDDEFDRRFGGALGRRLWSLFCSATAEQLSQRTGLRVDYQVQRMTDANELHGDKQRNPVGMLDFDQETYAGGGDATPVTKRDT